MGDTLFLERQARRAHVGAAGKAVNGHVGHEVEPLAPGSDEIKALHPFAKIPAFRHGDVMLFETLAICAYVDAAFDGPALQPADAEARARMFQWISVFNGYVYRPMVTNIVIQRLVVPRRGGEPDEARIKGALPDVRHRLGLFDGALSESDGLAGTEISLADLFLAPAVFYLSMTPEGQEMLPDFTHVGRWHEAIQQRPSFAATAPSGG